MNPIKGVSVIGAGTMGNGIAHVWAQHGYQVNLIDTQAAALERALHNISKNLDRQIKKGSISESVKTLTLENITVFKEIDSKSLDSELIIEAVTEKQEIKKAIFQELDKKAPQDSLLATNTSSISITKIASFTQRPEKVIGMHFMNPVPIMELVEVIKGYATSSETENTVVAICTKIHKTPIVVRDYPGFVANRILMPMINEAIYTLYEGVSGVEAIDTIMKMGMAHPMGPLQLADFIGLDVCLSILEVLHKGFGNPKYAPCPLLINMVNAGKLGIKSGEGFYLYNPQNTKDFHVSDNFQQ